MKTPINEKGLALITTMLLLALGFAVVAILLQLTTRQAKLTGIENGYSTALDGAKAGADAFIYNTQLCINANPSGSTTPCASPAGFGTLQGTAQNPCIYLKLFNPTTSTTGTNWSNVANWSISACGSMTSTPPTATATDSADIQNFPDLTLQLGSYNVYVKLVNTFVSSAPTSPTDPCYSSSGCYYYTVVSLARSSSGNMAQVQFIYRYPK